MAPLSKRLFLPAAFGLAAVLVFLAIFFLLSSGNDNKPTPFVPTKMPATKPEHERLVILGEAANDPNGEPLIWNVAQERKHDRISGAINQDEVQRILSLPYLQGSISAPAVKNITVYDANRAQDGVNVYNSGHEPAAFAIDMHGRVRHTWRYEIEKVWPDVPPTVHGSFWRRVHVYANGDLLAIFEGIGLIKIDRDSKLLWSYRNGCHHEVDVTDDGRIFVLTRRALVLPHGNPVQPVLVDGIAILDPQGRPLAEYSLLEMLERSGYPQLIKRIKKRVDVFHTNSLEVLDGRYADLWPYFKKGNILISLRNLNVVAIIDLELGKFVWTHSGHAEVIWRRQHDPKVVAGGRILLFDNLGAGGRSQVEEFDPRALTTTWSYGGEKGARLFSMTSGTSQRLAVGNTLITESDNGRALEVTPDKQIVWEFYNPHRAGDKNQLIATLFEMKRYPHEYFSWLAWQKPVR